MKFKNNLKESWQDDDFEFELDVDDTEVSKGNTFIEDGQEFTWYERVSDVAHLDFDNWAVWSALNPNSNSFAYFVVDEDTGFIDWGPVDTESEAKEFLQSKIDDYNDDDILVDNLNESQYNINEVTSRQKDSTFNEEIYTNTDTVDSETIVDHGMLGLVNSLIISEYDAIDQYNAAIATAEQADSLEIIPILKDIIAEEHVHVGQLQAAAKLFDTAAKDVEKGDKEAERQLEN